MSLSNPKINPPKKIGIYQVGELIGKGAIGWVYKGMNIETGNMVAIKQVSLQNIKEEQLQSIQSEINLLKRLKHENIVKYIDYIQNETHLNIILEYVENGSLAMLNKKFGPFQESLVSVYIKQVLQGLDYLHKQGVVHRDIKGANILTTKNGVVKLADFGVAMSLTEEKKSSTTFVGTPYWMAPEVIEMRTHISPACDIWSLACTVIELITGNPPYYNLNQYSALCRIVEDDMPSLPDNISENCKDFLIKCFQKEPTLRCEATTLLKHVWIRSQNQMIYYDIINSPDNELPEEVTNTIRMHIDKQQIINENNINAVSSYSEKNANTKFISDGEGYDIKKNNNQMNYKKENYNPFSQENSKRDLEDPILNTFNQHPSLKYSDSMKTNTQNYFTNSSRTHTENIYINESGEKRPNNSTIYEEGSFVSVDPNDPHINTNLNIASLQQLKLKKEFTKEIGENQRISNLKVNKKENKIFKEVNEIIFSISNFNDISDYERLVSSIKNLTELTKQNPKVKIYIMKQYGLSSFIEIIDIYLENLNTMVLHTTLQLINQLIENDNKLLELSYLFGILPYMLKFSNSEYPKNIRWEAAYFIGQMFYSSQNSHEILIACGGLGALNEFLDINYKDNKELICLSIDCLEILFDLKTLSSLNLCKILSKYHIIQRLLLLIDQINLDEDDPDMLKYLFKALGIIIHFAKCDDRKLKILLCENEIIQLLKIFLENFHSKPHIQIYIIKIFRIIAFEPTVLNTLENIGLLPIVLNLISEYVNYPNENNLIQKEEVLEDLLKIIFYLTKLNNPRQEQLALHSGIPLLITICKTQKIGSKKLCTVSIQILCFLVQTSFITREKLWEAGGPRIYIDNLDDKINLPKILDTLSIWLTYDSEKVENCLIETPTLNKLIELFNNSDKAIFQQIVTIFLKFIQNSEKIATKLGRSSEFLQELVERLGVETLESESDLGYAKLIKNPISIIDNQKKTVRNECSNPSNLIRKEILDILLHLCVKHANPRILLEKFDFYKIIVQIVHMAQNENIVILEEIATQLLQIYSENPNKKNEEEFRDKKFFKK